MNNFGICKSEHHPHRDTVDKEYMKGVKPCYYKSVLGACHCDICMQDEMSLRLATVSDSWA